MPDDLTLTKKIHFSMANKGRREIVPGPAPVIDTPDGRIPCIARLMALVIKFDGMIASGAVRDQAELAELGHVTRARVTQIMNLLHLAPDIQEAVLHLPRVTQGRDLIRELHLRPICVEPSWEGQRRMWTAVTRLMATAPARGRIRSQRVVEQHVTRTSRALDDQSSVDAIASIAAVREDH